MTDADIEQLLPKDELESPLTITDEVPIESEDVHIVYRVGKQTRFEATAEQGVGGILFCQMFIVYIFLLIVCCFT